ncbi:MAG TPA: 5-formyltetrahydrofolate cyclo-ligase [Phycisphaerales bacterium]|jgi:5-formyltetrahydrofolate cyclo-ligase|nr:5-formyltetrahydrofolate cyclo-ligase [Phycisphaerales bacterium]
MKKRTGKPSLKAKMRATYLARVGQIPPAARDALSSMVMARLETLDEYASANSVLFYWPLASLGEIDFTSSIRAALKAGKAVCLPRVDWKTGLMTARRVRSFSRDLETDSAHPRFRLCQPVAAAEPVPASRIDLVIVPGVAFDRAGGRLGRGAGYYDRLLFGLPNDRPIRVALAFDEQLSRKVPTEPHDQPVHIILTPSATIRVKPARRKLAPKARSGRNSRQAPSATRARPKR